MTDTSRQEEWLSARELALDPAALDLESAARLRFVLNQTFRYRYEGPVTRLEQRLMVLPPERHGSQQLASGRISVRGADGAVARLRDAFGNSIADVSVPVVEEAVEFHVLAVIERSGRSHATLPEAALRDPRYLAPTPLTEADDALTSAARDTVGALSPGLEAAERLSELVNRSLPYRKGATSIGTTAAEAFAIGAGVCQDHAHVMLALCRAVGIPARYVSGHLIGEGSTHAWVEVLLPGPGEHATALPLDPCHGRRAGADYVTVAVGRDYREVAPTSGAYHGRHANILSSETILGVTIVP